METERIGMTFTNINPHVEVVPGALGGTWWRLEDDYFYHWEHSGNWYRIRIPKGFRFDGASVPWFLRWIAGRGRFGVLAPLVHDRLHATKGYVGVERFNSKHGETSDWEPWADEHFTRLQADRMFFRILRETGVKPRWLRRGAFKLVRLWSVIEGDKWK